MPVERDNSKWITVKILKGLKHQIDEFCEKEENGFVNSSQYIHHVLKNDLDQRKRRIL